VSLTLSLPDSDNGDIKMILTSKSVDEILCCDHSNETSSAVHSHGTIILYLSLKKNDIWALSWILILGTLGSERIKITGVHFIQYIGTQYNEVPWD